jgi:thiosulfate/3-mercaptopyruvate sulfurtransferase
MSTDIHRTLVSPATLAAHLDDPTWAVVDCRFALADTEQGRAAYLASHIPGAVYAHLDADLSGPVVPGKTGRHPLPAVEQIAARLGAWGIDDAVQVVAYDDGGGWVAGRLWWLLRWLGHPAVAVLDGGWNAWLRAGGPTRPGRESRPARAFLPRPDDRFIADTDEVLARLNDPHTVLLDARAAERFRGENETIDPVAGHIPGALSAPYAGNLTPEGTFRPPEELRARYAALLGDRTPQQAIAYCGSGVSAVHTLIALEHAGLPGARLYPGSWSEWITDPARPVAK